MPCFQNNRVLFVNNLAQGGRGINETSHGAYAYGGAISNNGNAYSIITNSTFSGNLAFGGNAIDSGSGGGALGSAIFNGSAAEIILQNVTIINNIISI